MTAVRTARFADLDVGTLYALLRLRVDVFVVEQHCAYAELDGHDAEPDTWHLWTADETGPSAYLRLLAEPGGRRIGRVCTRSDARGTGLAELIMREALRLAGSALVGLDAQSQLVAWYERFGFTPDGPEFLEDGIPHVPMVRPAQ